MHKLTLALRFVTCLACLPATGWAQSGGDKSGSIKDYLVDIGAGSVSAANLVGAAGSLITNVQTSQDLLIALSPLSSNSQKAGYGLAITPARTAITPMSGRSYIDKAAPWNRLIGSTTFSYAENTAAISGISYRKSGYSLDTSIYLNIDEDPIKINYLAFLSCDERIAAEKQAVDAAEKGDQKGFDEFSGKAEAAQKKCAQNAKKQSKWNASKVALSYGDGRIRPDAGNGAQHSLGRTLTFSGTFRSSDDSAIQASVRKVAREVDLSTIAGIPAFKNSQLAAVRFTSGTATDSTMRWLAEISNAKASSITLANANFKYALGLDKKLYDGVWLEFRLGRSRTIDSGNTQTMGLLTLNWSPTSSLFAK